MASTSTSNSHSTSTSASPSTTTTTTTSATSCSSSVSHCSITPGANAFCAAASTTAAALVPHPQTPLHHSSSSQLHNETETETQVEVGKSNQEESTSPLPMTDSPKDKADNSSIKTRKKRKKNNSSCRVIRAGEDADDSYTFSSSTSASESEDLTVGRKRFLRKRENRRKNSPSHLSSFEFEDGLSNGGDNGRMNRKLNQKELPKNISERRLSRRKSSFFNKFPDLLWNSQSERNATAGEKIRANIPSATNLARNDEDEEEEDEEEEERDTVAVQRDDELQRQIKLTQDRRQFIDEQLKEEAHETTVSPSEMFSTHYNLRWKNHQSHMLLAFESLLYNESFVDVSLVCSCDDDDYEEEEAKGIKELNKLDHDEANDDEGKVADEVNANRNNEEGDGGGGRRSKTHKNESTVTIKAHKIVLSASSEFFHRIFIENPCKHPVVILTSFQRWEVQALVDFMYRGEVDVNSERLASIIKTADSLQIRGLAEYAEKFDTINKHGESIEPHSPSSHEHNLNTSSPTKLPPQIIMNMKTMEGLRRGLDRELLKEHRNASMNIDNDDKDTNHLEIMQMRAERQSLSPKLLNLSMGSSGGNSGRSDSYLSSKSDSGRNKSSLQREEPQAIPGLDKPPEIFSSSNHYHHRQKQHKHAEHQELLNNNGSSNDFIHHYGGGSVTGNNHNNTSPMLIPRRKQARPRRRSGDFVAVAQDLSKGNGGKDQLYNHDSSPPPENQVSRPSSQTPTSTPSSSSIPQNLSNPLGQNLKQVHHNNNHQLSSNPDHHNHIRQSSQSLNHNPQQSHHRRSSRHHRRSHDSHHHHHPRPIPIPNTIAHVDIDDHEIDDMDENRVLDYTTSHAAAHNSLLAAGLNHSVLGIKHWISSTSTPPLNQRNLPANKHEGESDDGLTPPPEQCHTPSISPTDPKGYPGDFPLFGIGEHPHPLNNRNLALGAFKTSPPSPSSFFLSGLSNANGPFSMTMSLVHSDESNNAGESAATPPNVFSPAGFPMPLGLPLTTSNNNNNSSSHGGPPGNPLNNSQGQRSSPVAWPGLPLGPAPIFGRHRAQHSAPRGGPPRAWSNADLTEALHNVWNKKMTTSQASRIFGIPYNSLLMYVRGKYGKSLKLDLLKKGLDLALENKANAKNASANAAAIAKESNNSSSNHNHSTISINNNNNHTSCGKSSRLSNSNNSSPSSQNINNNNISKSKSHHNQHHPHHHPHQHHHHHSQHSHHHHQSAGGSPPLGIGNIGLVGLGEPPDIPAGFNPFTAAASIFGDYPAPFPFASALSHILPPGSLITTDKVALNDDDK